MPLLRGLFSLLLSPGKSLFVYSPLLLLALPGTLLLLRRRGCEAILLLALAAGNVALFACWYDWGVGVSWGPRFLVPLVPLLLVVQMPWLEEHVVARAAGGVPASSCWRC